jgi:MFS transporter, FHS family, glucose/mannose:H+ symporter
MYKRKPVFAAACAGMLLFGISLITLGSVVPGLKDKFLLNDMAAGGLFSILPLGIVTGSFLFGPLCDKYGYKLLLIFSCFSVCTGFIGIAQVRSLALLKISVYLFGLGGGALNGATNAVMSDISDRHKAANLSILGVFFGIGALGMPFVIGALEGRFSFESILTGVGIITLIAGIYMAVIRFPPPKQAQGFPIAKSLRLVKDEVLVLIAFFLFCQSSFEAIINNWTTTFLVKQILVTQSHALYALSLFVAGMTTMRLLTGTLFRKMTIRNLLFISLILMMAGCLLMKWGNTFAVAVAGLISLGAGLAGGFPIMLGMVGNRYRELSATAFSFVLVIALVGNVLVNYWMGIVVYNYGVRYLVHVAILEVLVMTILSVLIFKKMKPDT